MRAANGQFVKGSHWRHPALHWDAAWLRNEWVHSNNNKNKEFLQ